MRVYLYIVHYTYIYFKHYIVVHTFIIFDDIPRKILYIISGTFLCNSKVFYLLTWLSLACLLDLSLGFNSAYSSATSGLLQLWLGLLHLCLGCSTSGCLLFLRLLCKIYKCWFDIFIDYYMSPTPYIYYYMSPASILLLYITILPWNCTMDQSCKYMSPTSGTFLLHIVLSPANYITTCRPQVMTIHVAHNCCFLAVGIHFRLICTFFHLLTLLSLGCCLLFLGWCLLPACLGCGTSCLGCGTSLRSLLLI